MRRRLEFLKAPLGYYPPIQFSVLRVIVGVYLFVHYAWYILSGNAYGAGQIGYFGLASPPYAFLTDLVGASGSGAVAVTFVFLLLASATCLIFGRFRIWAGAVLCFGWIHVGYLRFDEFGLLENALSLIVFGMIFLPKGEPMCAKESPGPDWTMPMWFFYGIWFLVTASFCVSGIGTLWAFFGQGEESYITGALYSALSFIWILAAIALFPLGLAPKYAPLGWAILFSVTVILQLRVTLMGYFYWGSLEALIILLFVVDPRWFTRSDNKVRVVFFDGVCGFCNSTVDFLIKADTAAVLKFSPLQGKFAEGSLPPNRIEDLDSIVYYVDGRRYYRTSAVLRIMRDIGGIWAIVYPLIVFPAFIRDPFYKTFAKHRYKWFGKREACRLPSPEERARFID